MTNFLDALPEVFVSDKELSALVNQALRQGKIRKIGSRLYSKNMDTAPEVLTKRNWYFLLKQYYPDALITDRTAFENKPAKDGSVFIISQKKRALALPGIIFKPRKGPPPLATDKPFLGGVRLASIPRAYLENMRPSKKQGDYTSRTLSQSELEERLERMIQQNGEDGVNEIREAAKDIAPILGLEHAFKKLDALIGTLLGTRTTLLKSTIGRARQKGAPYDPIRLERFLKLFESLKNEAPSRRNAAHMSSNAKTNLAFFEAYFSNFIEGTEFEIDEAVDIIFHGHIAAERPQDAHDILGTYRIAVDEQDMSQLPKTVEDLFYILKNRHATIMAARLEKHPGFFKSKNNQAGSTQFVTPELVMGTLEKGFELYQCLEMPLHRAIFMMFVITEVHPFTDGNGRVARIMMNAELVAAKEQKIIIPTIYRRNYLSALKALTHNDVTEPFIRMLDFAQKYTHSIDWSDFNIARQQLENTHAFMDSAEADELGIKLKININ